MYVIWLLACLLTYLPGCLPGSLTFLPTYLPIYLLAASISFFFPTYLRAYESSEYTFIIIIIIFNTHICNEQSVVSHKMLLAFATIHIK